MNRKWMVAGGLAAVLALVLGVVLGRNVIDSPEDTETSGPRPVAFKDELTGMSLTLPGTWEVLKARDPGVRLLAVDDPAASLLLRTQKSDVSEPVTVSGLPVVKRYTDELLATDKTIKQLAPADAVELGGLLGWRYRYTFKESDGSVSAHIHYFLFREGRLIQLVFQSTPDSRLPALERTFDEIAGTFKAEQPQ